MVVSWSVLISVVVDDVVSFTVDDESVGLIAVDCDDFVGEDEIVVFMVFLLVERGVIADDATEENADEDLKDVDTVVDLLSIDVRVVVSARNVRVNIVVKVLGMLNCCVVISVRVDDVCVGEDVELDDSVYGNENVVDGVWLDVIEYFGEVDMEAVSNEEVVLVFGEVLFESDDFVADDEMKVYECVKDFVFVDGVSIVDSLVDGIETVGDCVEDSGVESKDIGVMVLVEYCVYDAVVVSGFEVNDSDVDDEE